MTNERLNEIFEETPCENQKNKAFNGLQILSNYTEDLSCCAEHDVIYCASIDDIVDEITEEDATKLAELNWGLSEFGSFAIYVY